MPTKIPWADESINPLGWGCYGPEGTAEHPKRCPYCYAARMARRKLRACPQCQAFVPHLHPEEWEKVFRWKRPKRIFVESMGDLWGYGANPTQADKLTWVVASNPHHILMALTKNPQQMVEWARGLSYYPNGDRSQRPVPGLPPNLWLGVTCEDQAAADERIPLLLQTPAAVRFISLEPMRGLIDLCHLQPPGGEIEIDALTGTYGVLRPHRGKGDACLNWVICGNDSRPNGYPWQPEWVQSILDQCRAASVPVFVKGKMAARFPVQEWPQ